MDFDRSDEYLTIQARILDDCDRFTRLQKSKRSHKPTHLSNRERRKKHFVHAKHAKPGTVNFGSDPRLTVTCYNCDSQFQTYDNENYCISCIYRDEDNYYGHDYNEHGEYNNETDESKTANVEQPVTVIGCGCINGIHIEGHDCYAMGDYGGRTDTDCDQCYPTEPCHTCHSC